ncbi:MAG: hypothetical protein PHC88_05635 [Terrimicrobiaceae bacterium]|nr:hypothetical protein [Terrimicrobiaceae bacterium]
MDDDDQILSSNTPVHPAGPVCPFCQATPAAVSAHGPIELGQMRLMVLFCGNPACQKVWNVQVIAFEQPKVVTLPPNGRFVR